MNCRRCLGLMVETHTADELRNLTLVMWRCIMCGNLTDEAVEANGALPPMVDAGGKKKRDYRASFPIPQSVHLLNKEASHETDEQSVKTLQS